MASCTPQGNLCRCLDSTEAEEISSQGNVHVHCRCSICVGKAVYPMTAWRHLQRERLMVQAEDEVQSAGDNDIVFNDPLDCELAGSTSCRPIENYDEGNPDGQSSNSDGGSDLNDRDDTIPNLDGNDNQQEADDGGDSSNGDDCNSELAMGESAMAELDEEEVIKQFVFDAVLRLVEIKSEAGFSLKTLEDLLIWGRDLHCKQNVQMLNLWPSCWSEVLLFLENIGYKTPQLYWICLDDSHPCLFALMRTKTEPCIHCGKVGTIPYYYLSVTDKVKRWCSSPNMCRNMTAHWRENSHWLPAETKEGWGWSVQKEFWDGTRFSQLSYFWDPEIEWTLPVKCPENGCGTVISPDDVLLAPKIGNGPDDIIRLVECPSCQNIFEHIPEKTRGDPRNIAYDCELTSLFFCIHYGTVLTVIMHFQ